MKVYMLLGKGQMLQHRRRCDTPPEAQTRNEYFRKGAEIDHMPVIIQRLEGRGSRPFIIEFTIGVIFHNRYVVLIS